MQFYGLKTCDTCRKALKELKNIGVTPGVTDVRADGIPADVLAGLYARLGAELLNTRSTTWRGLDAADRAGDPVKLLAAHPTLMKRPVIASGDRVTVGWAAKTAAQWLGK